MVKVHFSDSHLSAICAFQGISSISSYEEPAQAEPLWYLLVVCNQSYLLEAAVGGPIYLALADTPYLKPGP